jgi:hypothetical protein
MFFFDDMRPYRDPRSHWVFVDEFAKIGDDASVDVRFESRRPFKGQEGEYYLILRKDPNGKLGWHFSSFGIIRKIQSENSGELNLIVVQGDGISRFLPENEATLNDYRFSLGRVSNFNNPFKHFSTPFLGISGLEFHAIIKGKIFMSRTAFCSILGALPFEHRLSFTQYFRSRYRDRRKDYVKAYRILLEYLDVSLTVPSKLLRASYNNLVELTDAEKANRIKFSESSTRPSDSLKEKYDEVTSYLELIEAKEWIESMTVEIENNLFWEREFNRVFQSRPWPYINDQWL